MSEDIQLSRQDIFEFMRDNELARIEISFSGGNDEGHVDVIQSITPQGEITQSDHHIVLEAGTSSSYKNKDGVYFEEGQQVIFDENSTDENGNIFRAYRPATDFDKRMEKFEQALCEPIWERYGGFAGEFSVYGKLIWSVENDKERVILEGQESEETWNEFFQEV